MSTLILTTEVYPLGSVTEATFVRSEIEALCRDFERVIIMPQSDWGASEPLPANAIVRRDFCGRLPLWKRLGGMVNFHVWRQVVADRSQIHTLKDLRGAMASAIYSDHYRNRLLGLIADINLDPADTLVYNYWFTAPAIAASMIDSIRQVSRAHGHDIYPVQGVYLSHSLRHAALDKMIKVYAASEAGAAYLRECYPDKADKIDTARLGSRFPDGLNPNGDVSEELTLLCVARTEPVKRIPMLFDYLKQFASHHPQQPLRLVYVGDGSEMPQVRHSAEQRMPGSLKVELLGELQNSEVHHLMATRHFDAMLLTSESEGLPISICEALSYGIPVIATAVGGVPEIVTPEVGALLSSNPTPDEFERILIAELPLLASKRAAAHARWEQHFDSAKLRSEFARKLRAFLK